MSYAKLQGGVLIFAPEKYTLPDGGVITNFNQSVALMEKYGFKKVINVQPEYDPATHYVVIDSYTESATEITVGYTVHSINAIDDKPIEEKVEELKTVDSEHEMALAELTSMIMALQTQVIELQSKIDGGVV